MATITKARKPVRHATNQTNGKAPIAGAIARIPVDQIAEHPASPREDFGDLQALGASMAEHDLLQPIVCRRVEDGETKFQLVCGHRRLRAARQAGHATIASRVIVATDQAALLMLAQENLHRRDLNPVELARLFARLHAPVEKGGAGLRQRQIGELYGISESHVGNMLRLRKLPPNVLGMIAAGEIPASAGWDSLLPLFARPDGERIFGECLKDREANPQDYVSKEDWKRMTQHHARLADQAAAPPASPSPAIPADVAQAPAIDAQPCESLRAPQAPVIAAAAATLPGKGSSSAAPGSQESGYQWSNATALLRPYATDEKALRTIMDCARSMLVALRRGGVA
jgi:ParB/RepB/Spo0J family partition protein